MFPATKRVDALVPSGTEALELAPTPLKAALFVDFDNIYLALGGRTNGNQAEQPSSAAENFAMHPERWLAWIEHGMPSRKENDNHGSQRRSVLIRRCYLNPGRFSRNRSRFVNVAFSVIDCPFLSHHGKNSADIHMVMDILDTLEHRTHFEEFIIFSGDSDFTPVLLRLREHNRRTTILTIGRAVEAYKAGADHVISGDTFIEEALGLGRPQTKLHVITQDPPKDPLHAAAPQQVGVTTEASALQNDLPSGITLTQDSIDVKEQIVARMKEMLANAARPINLAVAPPDYAKSSARRSMRHDGPGQRGIRMSVNTASGMHTHDRIEQLASGADGRDHFDLAGVFEQPARSLTHKIVVLGDYDSEAIRHRSDPVAVGWRRASFLWWAD